MTLKNTDNSYKITVRTVQRADGESDTVEETAFGGYWEKNGKQYIIYKTEGEDGVSSMIKIDGREIVIKRSGAVNTTMTYTAGVKTRSIYSLPYGSLEMEIETDTLVSLMSENGGKIKLVYTLTMQGEKFYNDTTITVCKR